MPNELDPLDYDRRSHVEDFCHVITEDADGLWSCQCSRDHEARRDCENACLANAMEAEVAHV